MRYAAVLTLGVLLGAMGAVELMRRFADGEKIVNELLDHQPWVIIEYSTEAGTQRFRALPIE